MIHHINLHSSFKQEGLKTINLSKKITHQQSDRTVSLWLLSLCSIDTLSFCYLSYKREVGNKVWKNKNSMYHNQKQAKAFGCLESLSFYCSQMVNGQWSKDFIRAHYEQHREDTVTNYERLLKEKNSQTNFFKILACVGFGILIVLLILEVANPNLGWLRF